MAVFTRTNGNAQNVVSVGNIALSTEATSNAVIISTGIGKPVRAFTVNSNVALTTALGTGEAVEAILGVFGQKATLLAYQVGNAGIGGITNGLVSILTEDNSWTTTDLEANIVALGTATGTNLTGVKVAEPGLKLVTTAGA